ncbi:8219_t:CDS:1, partial [Paraglomus brasilianum]
PKGHCSAIDSQENNQVETKARNSASSKLPDTEVSIPTSSHLVSASDNKSRPPISILPDDPKEKQKHVIKMILEQFRNLSLKYSTGDSDYFDCSTTCPICNKDHKKENIRDNVKGEWSSGDFVNTKTYRLKCWEAYQNPIQIITVKA